MSDAPRWTATGLNDAANNGVSPAEAIMALYAPDVLESDLGDIAFTCAPVAVGRFVTVTTERLARPLTTRWITAVRPSTRGEIAQWRKEFGRDY